MSSNWSGSQEIVFKLVFFKLEIKVCFFFILVLFLLIIFYFVYLNFFLKYEIKYIQNCQGTKSLKKFQRVEKNYSIYH